MDDWSNNACLGYAIQAMVNLRYTREQIQKVVDEMKSLFDVKLVGEADRIYCKGEY
jgi:hypothetical protein